jgi:hypothetical protein
MKNETVNHRNYFLISISTTIQLCQRKLKSFSLLPLLSSLEPWYSLACPARPAALRGRAALMAHVSNKRHLVGDVFIVIGVFGLVFHQIFSESARDMKWYYVNWYYFFYTIRPFVMMLFWSVAAFMYSSNHSGKIVFSLFYCAAILGIIHYSFFVHDYKSYHSFPVWGVWIMAGAIGIGFLSTVNHLVFVWEHKIKGNHKRFVGLAEMDVTKVDRDLRDRMLSDNANEYRNLYKNY